MVPVEYDVPKQLLDGLVVRIRLCGVAYGNLDSSLLVIPGVLRLKLTLGELFHVEDAIFPRILVSMSQKE